MKALVGQWLRFAIVGLGATFVHLAVAWSAARLASLNPFVANGCGFATAFALSYLGHFYWTFGVSTGHRQRLPRFLIVAGFGYLLTNIIVWIVTIRAGYSFEMALGLILFVVPASTWALSRAWAFRADT